jgi:hypothetical protein
MGSEAHQMRLSVHPLSTALPLNARNSAKLACCPRGRLRRLRGGGGSLLEAVCIADFPGNREINREFGKIKLISANLA